MATSADTTFDATRDEIIDDALANVGAVGPGVSATGRPREHAARALNRVVKAIDADGKFLWRVVRRTIPTVSGTATYTLAADVLDVDEPLNYRRAALNGRVPIRLMSQSDYMALNDRTTAGIPTMAFFERVLPTTVTLTFWPVPNTTADTIEYAANLRALDYDSGADTGDFPSRWAVCLVYGLTAELAPTYRQVPLASQMRKLFLEEKDRQLRAGAEAVGICFVPWG